MIYTRKDYMSNKCTHEEYYRQLVTQGMKEHVARAIPQALAKSTDPNLNDISLNTWDRLGMAYGLRSEFEELGDIRSKAGMVCVLKEAARQVKEETA
jgi:hypothetical protein